MLNNKRFAIVADTKYNNNNKNKNKKIMIIDDDKDITNLFSTFLEYNGYIIDAYTNPVEAFHNFTKNSHDLVILDLKMPKMGGMTLYHKIKEIDNNVIICFTTADINYIEDLRKGIIDIEKIVLYKPVLLKDLKNRIDLLLSWQEVNNKSTMMIL